MCSLFEHMQGGVSSIKVKNPGSEDPALVSSHRGVINISLHVVGRLEYWNIGSKIGMLSNLGISKSHVSYKVGGSP